MKMDKKNIAILGATSHIALSLLPFFLSNKFNCLYLFARNLDKLKKKSRENLDISNIKCIDNFAEFESYQYNLIINCVGPGTPNILGKDYFKWFEITELFDNKILNYLMNKNSESMYVSFSSGAVYGRRNQICDEKTILNLDINHLSVPDYYILARLNAEAKHRCLSNYSIVDIRLFSYFSQYIDIDAGYFMSDILKSLIKKEIFLTNHVDMVRDYIAPIDLYNLIMNLFENKKVNDCFDAYSLESISKMKVLNVFQDQFGLKYDFGQSRMSPNGEKNQYVSKSNKINQIGFNPTKKSIDVLIEETKKFLENRGNNEEKN